MRIVTSLCFLSALAALGCGSGGTNASDLGTPTPGSDLANAMDLGGAAQDLASSNPDLASPFPTNPNNAQAVTTGQTITGTLASMNDAHFYKYVPASAFTSVKVNTATLGPSNSFGQLMWQTDTMIGLCDTTGGLRCCAANAGTGSCNLTIREGFNPIYMPVVAGKTYYIIAVGGAGAPMNYSFSLTENP